MGVLVIKLANSWHRCVTSALGIRRGTARNSLQGDSQGDCAARSPGRTMTGQPSYLLYRHKQAMPPRVTRRHFSGRKLFTEYALNPYTMKFLFALSPPGRHDHAIPHYSCHGNGDSFLDALEACPRRVHA